MSKRNFRRLVKISVSLCFVLYFLIYFSFPDKLDDRPLPSGYEKGPLPDTGDWYVNPKYFEQYKIDSIVSER